MRPSTRAHPHLRLTAAILVAMLAALAGSLDATGESREDSRNRRGDLQTFSGVRPVLLLGGLRLVSCDDPAPRAHLVAGLEAIRFETTGLEPTPVACDRAEDRARARTRLDASRACGASLLRNTVLPPPIAC